MQVDNLDSLVVDNEDESLAIISAIDGLISKGTVTRKFDGRRLVYSLLKKELPVPF